MKGVLITFVFLFAFTGAYSQGCPTELKAQVEAQGFRCISREAANNAAENAKLVPVLEEKIKVQEQALADKDKNAEELKAASEKALNEVKEAGQKVLVDLGTATGQLIEARATIQTQNAMLQFMLQHGRNKCGGFTVICIQ